MKSKLLKLISTITLCAVSHMVSAKLSSCPSIDDLKHVNGFYIEYPLNLDINTKEAQTWLVANTQINPKKRQMQTLIFSPVNPKVGQYPSDAATLMIDGLELLQPNPECLDDQGQKNPVCACIYWNPTDGSLVTFLDTDYRLNHKPDFSEQLKANAKIMSKVVL